MNLLTKQTFRFVREGKADVVIVPSSHPQHVPDDIAEDPIFELAVKDGSITKIELPSADQPPAGDSKSDKPAAAPKRGRASQPAAPADQPPAGDSK